LSTIPTAKLIKVTFEFLQQNAQSAFASGQVGPQIAGRLTVRLRQAKMRDLGFAGKALGQPGGFMGAWQRQSAFGIFHMTRQYVVNGQLTSTDISRSRQISASYYHLNHTFPAELTHDRFILLS